MTKAHALVPVCIVTLTVGFAQIAQAQAPQTPPSQQQPAQQAPAPAAAAETVTSADVTDQEVEQFAKSYEEVAKIQKDTEKELESVQESTAVAKVKQDGVFGHVRLDFGRAQFVPFVYTGVGWVHYRGEASVFDTADRVVIPAGVGIEFHAMPLVVGARAEYQWNTAEISSQRLDYWKAVGTVGFRF